MSRASAAVRFPDGRIRFGIYNGTVDALWPHLFTTSSEAWEAWRVYYGNTWEEPNPPEQEIVWEVEIYSDYGGGMWWVGTSTWSEVIGPTMPYDEEDVVRHDGRPDWEIPW